MEQMRAGITILQTQDNVIVQEASSIFQGIHRQIADMLKKQTENGSTLHNHTKVIVKIQEENKDLLGRQNNMEEVIEGIQNFLETLTTKADLLKHTRTMDKTLGKIQEVSTGLTTHMETYTISEIMSHIRRLVQAGPSHVHSSCFSRIEPEGCFISTQDRQVEAGYRYGNLRCGNCSSGGSDGSESPDVPDRPPGSPNPPRLPNPPGPPNLPAPPLENRCRKQRTPEMTPVKLKEPHPVERKPADNFET